MFCGRFGFKKSTRLVGDRFSGTRLAFVLAKSAKYCELAGSLRCGSI